MQRRQFMLGLTALAASGATASKTRIVKITSTPIQGRFHKFVAMNAYDQVPKGHTYEHSLIRIKTADGVEGIGAGLYAPVTAAVLEEMRPLLGADPLDVYHLEGGRIVGRSPRFDALLRKHCYLDGPLFDLIGKLTGKPAWALLGNAVRERIPAYDGTLYLSDVWFHDRGVPAVVEEVQEAVRKGYAGVKLKLGRGLKWMPKEDGLARDVAVVNAVRAAVGPDIRIMGDPNNGYKDDFEGAWKLLQGVRQSNLYWIEEAFPESVDGYTRLKAKIAEAGMQTLIADGENLSEPAPFLPYMKPKRLIDVVQMDIRRGGFLSNLELSEIAGAAGGVSIPHNWASQIGVIMGLHLSKAAIDVPMVEDDRSTCDVLKVEGCRFEKGTYALADTPGLGISVDEKTYRSKYAAAEVAVS